MQDSRTPIFVGFFFVKKCWTSKYLEQRSPLEEPSFI